MMFQRELLIFLSLTAAIFLAVAGAGWFAVRELHETSRMMVVDTLPGLVDAGLASERMNDNRRILRDMLDPHTAAERMQMIAQVRTNSTEKLWHDYANSIFEPIDQQNYKTMMLVRSNYALGCEQFFAMLSSGQTNEASALYYGDLTWKFRKYNEAAKTLFDYNTRQGTSRGRKILNSLFYAPWVIAGLTMLVFLCGLILGMRSALSGPPTAARRPPAT